MVNPKTIRCILTVLLYLLIQPSINSSASGSKEKELLDHLLQNYSKHSRPVHNYSKPVIVTLGFNLIQIVRLAERDQKLATKIWLRMAWTNELLDWEPSRWNNITITRLNRKLIWTPDIFLQEDLGDDISSGPDSYETPIKMNFKGEHMWLIPVILKSSCMIDITNFPFDQQVCHFVFTSWTHDQSELDLLIEDKPVVSETYINSSEWNLLNVSRELNSKRYACCKNSFVEIKVVLTLQRKPLYYMYNVVVPCIVQMVIILFTFFLPPDSGERIGVVITVLLLFALYLDVLGRSLPKSSNSTPALSHFYLVAMIECACSLVATSFVLVIHFRGSEKGVKPMPDWLRSVFLKSIGKVVMVRRYPRKYDDRRVLQNTFVDTNEGEMKDTEHNEVTVPVDMTSVMKEVRVITSLIHDANRQAEIEEEWQVLAKVMDRIFVLLFLIIFVVSSMTTLYSVYLKCN